MSGHKQAASWLPSRPEVPTLRGADEASRARKTPSSCSPCFQPIPSQFLRFSAGSVHGELSTERPTQSFRGVST